MSRIIVFQHAAYEPLGLLYPLLKKSGFRIRYVNFVRDQSPSIKMEGYDGLVVLGGPMGAYETEAYPHLLEEMRCIREAVAHDKPVLGICLGAQLIAAALGAKVERGHEAEIGWYRVKLTAEGKNDPVLGVLQESEKIFQWHQDYYHLPDGGVWLATSESCPYQAFRYGNKVYGFQFHLEVDEKMIERWLQVPENACFFQDKNGEERKVQIREQTAKLIEQSQILATKVFTRYINLCNERSKLRWMKL